MAGRGGPGQRERCVGGRHPGRADGHGGCSPDGVAAVGRSRPRPTRTLCLWTSPRPTRRPRRLLARRGSRLGCGAALLLAFHSPSKVAWLLAVTFLPGTLLESTLLSTHPDAIFPLGRRRRGENVPLPGPRTGGHVSSVHITVNPPVHGREWVGRPAVHQVPPKEKACATRGLHFHWQNHRYARAAVLVPQTGVNDRPGVRLQGQEQAYHRWHVPGH